jgi:hypothetical protein
MRCLSLIIRLGIRMHRGHWDGVFLGEYTHCMAWRVMDMNEQDEAILKCLNLALVLSLPLPCLAIPILSLIPLPRHLPQSRTFEDTHAFASLATSLPKTAQPEPKRQPHPTLIKTHQHSNFCSLFNLIVHDFSPRSHPPIRRCPAPPDEVAKDGPAAYPTPIKTPFRD